MSFPDFIRALPRPKGPFKMDAHIVPSEHVMTMFYQVDQDLVVPEHAHGPQWGVVLDGSMEMTIGGETRTYTRGDTYYVPHGALHAVHIHAGFRGIDVFADAHRYEPLDQQ